MATAGTIYGRVVMKTYLRVDLEPPKDCVTIAPGLWKLSFFLRVRTTPFPGPGAMPMALDLKKPET